MSDFNLAELIADMTKEEAVAFVTSHLNEQTKAEFLATKRTGNQAQLRKEYDTRIAGLSLAGLDTNARIRKISVVKKEFIDRGLDIG